MKEDKFFEMLADIDDQYIREAHEEDLETPTTSPVKKVPATGRRGLPHWVLPLGAGIAALALVTFGLWKAGIFGGRSSLVHKETLASIEEHNATVEETSLAGGGYTGASIEATTPAVLTIETSDEAATTEGIVVTSPPSPQQPSTIPAFPSDRSIVLKGNPITDEDADAFFAENRDRLTHMIDSCGLPTDDLQFNKKGFYHIAYDGIAGESLTINQSHRDYLIYNGEQFVARITLFRVQENGEEKIYYTFGYGGTWFPEFEKYLEDHKGEKLLFFYANSFEIVMAPDGSVMNPMGTDPDFVAKYFEGVEHPYETLYNELAVYTP